MATAVQEQIEFDCVKEFEKTWLDLQGLQKEIENVTNESKATAEWKTETSNKISKLENNFNVIHHSLMHSNKHVDDVKKELTMYVEATTNSISKLKEQFTDSIDNVEERVSKNEADIVTLQTSIEIIQNDLEHQNIQERLDNVDRELKDQKNTLTESVEKYEAELEDTKADLEDIQERLDSVDRELQDCKHTLTESLEKCEAKLEDTKDDLEDTKDDLEDIKEELKNIKDDLENTKTASKLNSGACMTICKRIEDIEFKIKNLDKVNRELEDCRADYEMVSKQNYTNEERIETLNKQLCDMTSEIQNEKKIIKYLEDKMALRDKHIMEYIKNKIDDGFSQHIDKQVNQHKIIDKLDNISFLGGVGWGFASGLCAFMVIALISARN